MSKPSCLKCRSNFLLMGAIASTKSAPSPARRPVACFGLFFEPRKKASGEIRKAAPPANESQRQICNSHNSLAPVGPEKYKVHILEP